MLAQHRRSYDSSVVIEAPTHLEKLTAEKRRAGELRRRDRLRGACPSAAGFLEALALRGEPIANHAARLARLLDDHGAAAIEAALVEALQRGAISAEGVAYVFDRRARARKAPRPSRSSCPTTRGSATCASPRTRSPTTTLCPRSPRRLSMTPLAEQLTGLGLHHAANLVALSTKRRFGPIEILVLVNARKRGNLRRPDLGTDARMRGNLRRVRGLG